MGKPLTAHALAGLTAVALLFGQPAVVCGLACLTGHHSPAHTEHAHHESEDRQPPCQGGSITAQTHTTGDVLGPAVPAACIVPAATYPLAEIDPVFRLSQFADPLFDLDDPPPRT